MVETARARRGRGRPDEYRSGDRRSNEHLFDRELDHLPAEVRWREWMNRVEATIFAASEPVGRETYRLTAEGERSLAAFAGDFEIQGETAENDSASASTEPVV